MSEEEKKLIDENIKGSNAELSEDTFIGFTPAGEKKIFYKLLEFDSEETGKHYLAYTDNELDENGNTKAYGAVVTYDNNYMKLEAIQSDKEWKVIETALRVLQDEIRDNNETN